MGSPKIAVAIPYKQRIDNLEIAFEGLANQTMDRSDFEVVVGAMEYSGEYVGLCREFTDRINIVSVLSAQDFAIPHARNLAMRQASAEVIVHMDADTLLPHGALQNLYARHFAFGQNVCVVGQVIGYGNNNDGDVQSVEARPYAHYQGLVDELERSCGRPKDPRFQVDHVIPWAFAWTGLIALPMATVRRHDLFFDETFRRWGVDDLEWGYRICASGTPIVLREDVYGLHLPHRRDSAANRDGERENYRRFLRKWPRHDVELANAFGDFEANGLFLDYVRELRAVCGGDGRRLGTIRGPSACGDLVVVGAAIDAEQRVVDSDVVSLFDDPFRLQVLPLTGLALPYEDQSIDECRILTPISRLSPRYRNVVQAEARRASKRVVMAGRV